MVKQEKWIILLLPFFLLCSISALSQTPAVDVQALLAPVTSLTMNDLDFINTTTPEWLFTITLTPRAPVPLQVRMNLRLALSLAGDGRFDRAAYYQSPVFELAANRTLTNFDLRNPEFRAPLTFDSTARRQVEATGLPGGSVPSGVYQFFVEITTPDGGTVLGNDDEQLTVTNPGVVELLLPYDGEFMPTPYPLFQWRGDSPSWNISVYHRLPGQMSPEETASGIPHLTANVTGVSFPYPSSGVRALQTGESYVWYVEGVLSSTGGGERRFRSPLRSFTVADGPTALSPSLLDELERSLGPRYHGLIEQLRSEGSSPTGIYRLNGSTISAAELMNILGVLRSDPDAVTSVVIE